MKALILYRTLFNLIEVRWFDRLTSYSVKKLSSDNFLRILSHFRVFYLHIILVSGYLAWLQAFAHHKSLWKTQEISSLGKDICKLEVQTLVTMNWIHLKKETSVILPLNETQICFLFAIKTEIRLFIGNSLYAKHRENWYIDPKSCQTISVSSVFWISSVPVG